VMVVPDVGFERELCCGGRGRELEHRLAHTHTNPHKLSLFKSPSGRGDARGLRGLSRSRSFGNRPSPSSHSSQKLLTTAFHKREVQEHALQLTIQASSTPPLAYANRTSAQNRADQDTKYMKSPRFVSHKYMKRFPRILYKIHNSHTLAHICMRFQRSQVDYGGRPNLY